MNNEAKRFNTAVQKRGGSSLDLSANSEMFSRFKDALEKKIWLTGEEQVFEGERIDMTHFEFMMACLKLPMEVDRYQLQQFYASLWPYVKKIIKSYESLDNAFEIIVKDQEVVLKNHAEQNLELDIYKRFFKKELPNEIRMKFKRFKEAEEARVQEQMEAAIAKEKEFRDKQLSTQEQKALERKFKI